MSSRTLNNIIKHALQARFHIHPLPRDLAQTTAIFNYFETLVANANTSATDKTRIIQFRQAKNPKTATRLNNFQITFRDQLPEGSAFADPELVAHVSFHERCEQIKSRMLQSEKNLPSAKDLTELYNTANMFNNAPPGLVRPSPQSSIYISSREAPTPLERALLQTSVVAVDNNTHQPLPLGEALQIALLKSTHDDDSVTLFTLDLASLTRDPKVISHNAYMRLFAHYRLDSKQAFDERVRSLDRLRQNALRGFSGEFYA
jgi:hypothetical protein